MATAFNSTDLQKMIADFQQATDANTKAELQKQAEAILQEFVNTQTDIDIADLPAIEQFIQVFGVESHNDSTVTPTQLGQQAYAKLIQILHNKERENNIPESPDQEGRQDEQTAKKKLYAMTSDENQIMFDRISFVVLQRMRLIDPHMQLDTMTPAQVAKEIDNTKMTDEQRTECIWNFVDVAVQNQEIFELLPPNMLAVAYTLSKSKMSSAKTPDELQELTTRYHKISQQIDTLIQNFYAYSSKWDNCPANIMDLQDGYKKMFTVRQADLEITEKDSEAEKDYKTKLNEIINKSRETLESKLAEYDELYKLTKVNPEHADELLARWKELKERLGQIELTPDTLKTAAKYEFLDENGQQIPQFLDENGQPALEYKEGHTLDPKGRLAQIINLARHDVTMENVADLDQPVKDMDLNAMLNAEVPWTFAEISVPDQIRTGLIQEADKDLTLEKVEKFWDTIETDGGYITDQGYQDALDAHTNNTAGYATRLAYKVDGADKPVVLEPLNDIRDIDRLAETRTEKVGAYAREQKLNIKKRMLKNFGMGFAVSAGLTFLGKVTGVSYIGAAIGTSIGIGNMIYQGFKWRKEQKAQGKPHGIKEFFADKRNWGPAITSGLGIAATISLATGNPGLATAFGLGAVTAGVSTSASTAYKDAINAGYSKKDALRSAIGVGASGALGALAGGLATNVATSSTITINDATIGDTSIPVPTLVTDLGSVFSPYEIMFPGMVGMLGIYEPREIPVAYTEQLRERIGALANAPQAEEPEKQQPENTDNIEDAEIVEENTGDDKIEDKTEEDKTEDKTEEDKTNDIEDAEIVEENTGDDKTEDKTEEDKTNDIEDAEIVEENTGDEKTEDKTEDDRIKDLEKRVRELEDKIKKIEEEQKRKEEEEQKRKKEEEQTRKEEEKRKKEEEKRKKEEEKRKKGEERKREKKEENVGTVIHEEINIANNGNNNNTNAQQAVVHDGIAIVNRDGSIVINNHGPQKEETVSYFIQTDAPEWNFGGMTIPEQHAAEKPAPEKPKAKPKANTKEKFNRAKQKITGSVAELTRDAEARAKRARKAENRQVWERAAAILKALNTTDKDDAEKEMLARQIMQDAMRTVGA